MLTLVERQRKQVRWKKKVKYRSGTNQPEKEVAVKTPRLWLWSQLFVIPLCGSIHRHYTRLLLSIWRKPWTNCQKQDLFFKWYSHNLFQPLYFFRLSLFTSTCCFWQLEIYKKPRRWSFGRLLSENEKTRIEIPEVQNQVWKKITYLIKKKGFKWKDGKMMTEEKRHL